MPVQRLVVVALVLVAVLGLASVAGRPPAGSGPGSGTGTTEPRRPPAPTGGVVEADLADADRVRARVGDVVVLRFEAGDGRVTIPELGVDEGVLAGVPTTVRFVAVAEGRYAVRVGDPPRRRIATVVVAPAQRATPDQPPAPEAAPDRPITARADRAVRVGDGAA